MMGHGYHGNNKNQCEYLRKFAWWPVRSKNHKLIFLHYYYVKQTYYDNKGQPPKEGLYWLQIYTEKEYFLLKITGRE